MTVSDQDQQLLALRDCFAQLGRAIAISDLSAIEQATQELRALMDQSTHLDAQMLRTQRPLLEQLDLVSSDVEALLASRIRAYDQAISAFQATQGDQ